MFVLGLLVSGVVLTSCGILPTAGAGPVEITQLFSQDDGLGLGVASCNGAPEATVSDLIDGQYLVEVRTTQQWERGNECLDVVVINVDMSLDSFEIIDLTSGDVFPYPPVIEAVPPSVDIDGVWQMVEVNGEQVEVGVNTIEIPKVEIEAGFLSGRLGCNGGGAELLIDGAQVRGFLESTAELCSIPDGSEEMVLTERIFSSMLTSGDGFNVERAESKMIWRMDAAFIVFELLQ